MGAVYVLPPHIDLVCVREKVPAVHIVDIAVAVIVDPVVRDLVCVGPDGVFKLRMGDIHAGVDEGHGYGALVRNAFILSPGIPDVDVNARIGLGFDGGKIAGTQGRKGDGRNTPISPADIGIVNACKIQLLLGLA